MSNSPKTLADRFEAMAATTAHKDFQEMNLKNITYRIDEIELKKIDFLATNLNQSRQFILNEILNEGIRDAVIGFGKGLQWDDEKTLHLLTFGCLDTPDSSEYQEELKV